MVLKQCSIADIVDKLRNERKKSKQDILDQRNLLYIDVSGKLKKDDTDDIQAQSEVISLKDPINRCRITTPIRSSLCKHVQCFDAMVFFQMNQQVKESSWKCPVCNKNIVLADMIMDGYFDDILQNTSSDLTSATVDPDGTWKTENTADRMGVVDIDDKGTEVLRNKQGQDIILIDDDDDDLYVSKAPSSGMNKYLYWR